MTRPTHIALLTGTLLLAGCAAPSAPPAPGDSTAVSASVEARIQALDDAVSAWGEAGTLAEAAAGAEAARNLVTGPGVAGYGDLDGDGRVAGGNEVGLLPGEDGEPGLVVPPTSTCVVQDVLGGSWTDPAARWAEVRTRIDDWSPSSNTFPGLPSHPQRVVGWASLTLGTTSLGVAHEYAGHARLHVEVTREALTSCPAGAREGSGTPTG